MVGEMVVDGSMMAVVFVVQMVERASAGEQKVNFTISYEWCSTNRRSRVKYGRIVLPKGLAR